MHERDAPIRSPAATPAHDIRRFESAIWSLYILSDNPTLPPECRAACRVAAEFAVASLRPGDRAVQGLVELVIEVGGGEVAPPPEALLGRLRQVGWQGAATALDAAPPPLEGPPPRNIVSDKMRAEAFERILKATEVHLNDPDLSVPERNQLAGRLAEIRASKQDMRTRTERAWELLELVERNLYARTRETGEGG